MSEPNAIDIPNSPAYRVIKRLLNRETLAEALKNEGLNAYSFNVLLGNDQKAARDYVRALEMRADLDADDVVHIADTDDDPARARNRITARQWRASKQYGKRYGERIDMNVTQTLDIGATLAEARSRAISARYQQPLEHVQVVDLPGVSVPGATDKQSVRVIDAPQYGAVPDIFD